MTRLTTYTLLIGLLTLLPAGLFAQTAIVQVGEQWRLYDLQKGDFISEAYDNLQILGRTRVAFRKTADSDYGIMDASGKVLLEPTYQNISSYVNGFAFGTEGYIGYWAIDTNGQRAFDQRFSNIGDFSAPTADCPSLAAAGHDGYPQIGYMNTEGEFVHDAVYETALNFREGKVLARLSDGSVFVLNCDGTRRKLDLDLDIIGDVSDGLVAAKPVGNKHYGYINLKGEFVIAPQFTGAGNFINGLAIVNTDYKYGLINKQGDVILPTAHRLIYRGPGPVFLVNLGPEGFQLFDAKGQPVNKALYTSAKAFEEGFFAVQTEAGGNFLRPEGTLLLKPGYTSTQSFRNAYAAVELDELFGLIDQNGKEVLKPQFEAIKGVIISD
ncbi:MAG: WG repeat-containing protein [Bacteroidota bacterium]